MTVINSESVFNFFSGRQLFFKSLLYLLMQVVNEEACLKNNGNIQNSKDIV